MKPSTKVKIKNFPYVIKNYLVDKKEKRRIEKLKNMSFEEFVSVLVRDTVKFKIDEYDNLIKCGIGVWGLYLDVYDYEKIKDDSLASCQFLINELFKNSSTYSSHEAYEYQKDLVNLKSLQGKTIKRGYGDIHNLYLEERNRLNKLAEKYIIKEFKKHNFDIKIVEDDSNDDSYDHTLVISF